MGVSIGEGTVLDLAVATTAITGGRIRPSRSRRRTPAHAQPSPLIATNDLRFPIGAGGDKSFTDQMITDHLIAAEQVLETKLASPLQAKVIDDFYRGIADRHRLSVRALGEAGLGTVQGAPDPQGGAQPAKPVVTINGDTAVDPDTYIVDMSGEYPAVAFTERPTTPLSRHIENPVQITYEYAPVVPERIKACLVVIVRAQFLTHSAGTTYPWRQVEIAVDNILEGIAPWGGWH